MILFKTGDIFTTTAPIIGHGTNTEGKMASGIALEFKKRYPLMHTFYKQLCKEQDSSRLVGTAAIWTAEYTFPLTDVADEKGKIIANIFSQDKPGAHAQYGWARKGINHVMNFAIQNGIDSIALPRIGSGVGGLDWKVMQVMIFDNFEKFSVDIELWSLPDAV